MAEIKVAKEVAENDFEGWTEENDLDLDTAHMDAEDRTAFEKQKRRIIKAVMHGNLVFEDENAIYTPFKAKSKFKDPITITMGSLASLMAQDGKKKNEDIKKTLAVTAAMCGVTPKTISGLHGEDYKVMMALFALLVD